MYGSDLSLHGEALNIFMIGSNCHPYLNPIYVVMGLLIHNDAHTYTCTRMIVDTTALHVKKHPWMYRYRFISHLSNITAKCQWGRGELTLAR